VAAYNSPRGCIVAPSREAKALGIKTGMTVGEGRMLCPSLIVKEPDPNKYRAIFLQLKKLLSEYTFDLTPKSIDEFVLNLEGYPAFKKGMWNVGLEIKQRIKEEIGEFLTVSVGIAPNRFLAKTAAGLHKPDGLDQIEISNYKAVFSKLELMDLCGIKRQNCIRLNQSGIFTVFDFFNATPEKLHLAFGSVVGVDWYMRMHGWEPDDVVFGRHSYGNSFALPKPLASPEELAPLLQKLVEKTGMRMRRAGYNCRGVHVAILYRDGSYWHHGVTCGDILYDSRDLYALAFKILCQSPYRKAVANLAESVFNLERNEFEQTSLLVDHQKKKNLVAAMDSINEKYGFQVITPAMMLGTKNIIPDRVAFGGIKELEEIVLN
jgi:DNA polymerase-4